MDQGHLNSLSISMDKQFTYFHSEIMGKFECGTIFVSDFEMLFAQSIAVFSQSRTVFVKYLQQISSSNIIWIDYEILPEN